MRHAHDGRGANLLGALSVTLADRLRAATDAGAGQGGSAPGALISLAAIRKIGNVETGFFIFGD